MAMQTQWRIGMSGYTGMDYTALESVMRFHQVKDKRAMFNDIQLMETAALKALNRDGGK